jgi:hypothetical protein
MSVLTLQDAGFLGSMSSVGGAGYDANAEAMFTARAADSDEPSAAYKQAISDYVVALKAVSGLWADIVQLVVPAGATTIAGACRSIKGNDLTPYNMVNGDADLKTGIKGNATNKWLSTNYAGNFTGSGQNDFHAYMRVTEAPTVSGDLFGQGGPNGIGRNRITWNGTTGTTSCRDSTNTAFSAAATGGYGVNRTSSASYERLTAGSTSTVNTASTLTNAATYILLARSGNNGSVGGIPFSDARFVVWAMGGGTTTLADYNTATDSLVAALNAL